MFNLTTPAYSWLSYRPASGSSIVSMFPPADTTMDRLTQGRANSPTQGFLGLPDELLLQVIYYLSLSDIMLVRKVLSCRETLKEGRLTSHDRHASGSLP